MGSLTALGGVGPVVLERWFARQGAPATIDMARSGAPDLTTAELLDVAGDAARVEYLSLPLGYGDPEGTHRLRSAIVAAGYARRVDEVVVTCGAVEALLLAVASVTSPGDRVAVGCPAYGGLVRAAEAAGARVREVPVWHAGSARLDLGGLCTAVVDCARTALLNSPHNPTGAIAASEDLASLAQLCADRGGAVVVDEVAISTLDLEARSVTSHEAFGAGTIVTIGDVSKALGLGGLRIGWLSCADGGVLRRAAELKDVTTLAPSLPAQMLAALALEHRDHFRSRIAAVARANRETLAQWAGDARSYAAPADGLVAFPPLLGVVDTPAFARRLRARAGVDVAPGALFGTPRHIRVGLGVDATAFTRGLDAIAGALA